MGHAQIAAIIPRARSVAEIDQNVETFSTPIPQALCDELEHEQLLRENAPTP